MKQLALAVAAGTLVSLLLSHQLEAAKRDARTDDLCRRMKRLEKSQPTDEEGVEAMKDLKKSMLLFEAEVIRFNQRDPRQKLSDAAVDVIERQNKLIRMTARAQSIQVGLDAFCAD